MGFCIVSKDFKVYFLCLYADVKYDSADMTYVTWNFKQSPSRLTFLDYNFDTFEQPSKICSNEINKLHRITVYQDICEDAFRKKTLKD